MTSKRTLKFKILDSDKNTTEIQCLNKTMPEEWNLLEFTGLLDKNNNEIYEGDIVSLIDLTGKYTVDFYKGCFMAYDKENDKYYPLYEYHNLEIEVVESKKI